MGYIDSGIKQGAKVITGGKRVGEKGYFIEPTIFVDVKDNMTIAKVADFGTSKACGSMMNNNNNSNSNYSNNGKSKQRSNHNKNLIPWRNNKIHIRKCGNARMERDNGRRFFHRKF